MARGEFLVFAIFIAVITVFLQEASALHCWHCNNEPQTYCDDPFNIDKLTDAQKFGSTAECPAGEFERSVCIKMVSFKDNGKKIITRACGATRESATATCEARQKSGDDICEICDTDSCNSAEQYGPTALLITIPLAIAKMFSL